VTTPVSGIGFDPLANAGSVPQTQAAGGGEGFGDFLVDALGQAGQAEKTADEAAQRFAAGDPAVGIHEVMIAAEKAEIQVRFAVTATNRAIEAYRELMNTSL
jgi:flagellar hook-basal body complex protein FliE